MPGYSALTVVDAAIAAEQAHAGSAPPSTKDDLRTQAALVRSLVDEVESCLPSDRVVTPLRHQLADELALLARVAVGESVSRAPSLDVEDGDGPIDVLIVDDEEGARRTAVRVLERLGYPCRTAADASEALEEHARKPAAIVLSDWCMPGMDGLELCVALKRQEARPYVILVTAFHEKGRLLDVVRHGADDFLRKPMDIEELEARLFAASRLIRAVQATARVCAR